MSNSSSAAVAHLKHDPIMRGIIEKCEVPEWSQKTDLFHDLVDAVISQQLSGKAAATIFGRFKELFDGKFPKPLQIIKMPDEKMRGCGISYSKIKYIKGIAQAVENKELDLKKLPDLADEKVTEELIKLKGIGKWTAEMILIFSLRRPDVFSVGDLGLRNSVSRFYKVDRDDLEKIEKISLKWSPYRSMACRYLWQALVL